MDKKIKNFKPTNWSIDNKTSIYVLVLILMIFGMVSYNRIAREQFPEIVIQIPPVAKVEALKIKAAMVVAISFFMLVTPSKLVRNH